MNMRANGGSESHRLFDKHQVLRLAFLFFTKMYDEEPLRVAYATRKDLRSDRLAPKMNARANRGSESHRLYDKHQALRLAFLFFTKIYDEEPLRVFRNLIINSFTPTP